MRECVTRYEKITKKVDSMYPGFLDWQKRNVVRTLFAKELVGGATIGSILKDDIRYTVIHKPNGREYRYISKVK